MIKVHTRLNSQKHDQLALLKGLILCDPSGKAAIPGMGQNCTKSPILCFDLAVDQEVDMVIVRFGPMPSPLRSRLVILCQALNHNSHTKECLILALFDSWQRELMEELKMAGVDFVKCVGDMVLDPASLHEIISSLKLDDLLDNRLASLCPYLHYRVTETNNEMTVCGAYKDRMVLGGERLQVKCESLKHRECEFFLSPRQTC